MRRQFDCVELQHKGTERIRKKTFDMNKTKELKFWQECSTALKEYRNELLHRCRRRSAA